MDGAEPVTIGWPSAAMRRAMTPPGTTTTSGRGASAKVCSTGSATQAEVVLDLARLGRDEAGTWRRVAG